MSKHNQYLANKNKRAEIARTHTEEVGNKYFSKIQDSVKKTRIYSNLFWDNNNQCDKNIYMSVKKMDAVSALFDCAPDNGRVALLNFASYKHPGGGFIVGSKAQEEALCHESFLYNVLKEFDETYYEENRKDFNHGLYKNRALYSPDIYFEREGNLAVCDVITCASPNFSAASNHVTCEQNNICMRERIRFILEIAKSEKIDTFIVGAWGCGVFKQDPKFVAQCFEEECQKVFVDSKIHLVFAVIPSLPNRPDNLTPFVEMTDRWNSAC